MNPELFSQIASAMVVAWGSCAAILAATAWPDLPWRAENAKTCRSEMTNLSVSRVLTLAVSGDLAVPGLLLV